MFPLNVILIGNDENLLPHVERECLNVPANVEARYPDVATTVLAMPMLRDQKRLLAVILKSSADLQALKRLSTSFAGWPILALTEGGKDSSTLLSAMRAGACQVVPLPLDIGDFRLALECIAEQFAYFTRDSRTIAISNVTGGCGATTLAVNLGYEFAARHQLRCIVVEFSVQMGMLSTYLNVEPRFTTHDLLQSTGDMDMHVVEQTLTPIAERLFILAGPADATSPLAYNPEDVGRILDYLKRLADVVVMDVPYAHDSLYLDTIGLSHQAVLVGEQKVPSIRAMRLVRDAIEQRIGAPKIYMGINRYNPEIPGFNVRQLASILQTANLYTISNDYANVMNAVNQGRPLRLVAPGSSALSNISCLAHTLLGLEQPTRRAGVLRRLAGASGRLLLRACGIA